MFSTHVENKLTAFLHEELNERTARKVRSHLQTCETCQAQLQQLKQADEAAQQRPLFTPDENLWANIAAKLPVRPMARPEAIRRRNFGHTWLPKSSYATAFIILVTLGWWWFQNDVPATNDDWPHWRGKNQEGKAIQTDGPQFDSGIKLSLAWNARSAPGTRACL
jgi:predicted anti-sigma-YlaC factor YlaD